MPETEAPVPNEHGHILVLDDEEIVLTSIRSLLKIETDYTVECQTNPQAALEYVRQNNVDLVIADYLMPGVDGITFMSQVRDLNPEITRILLTGYADKESAIKAINEVGLFHYIEKPWDNEELLLVIRNGLEKRFLLKQLRDKVSELDEAHDGLKDTQKRLLKAFV